MSNGFILSELVTNNIMKEDQSEFIRKQNLLTEYSSSGKAFNYFVQDAVREDKINQSDVEEFLFESLFYGYQRATYVYYVGGYNQETVQIDNFIEVLQKKYDYVSDCMYNNIVGDVGADRELVAIKVIYSTDLKRITKARFLFKKPVAVLRKNGIQETLSYIPVEWDVARGVIIAKVSPKRRLYNKILKPEYLNKDFVNKLKEIFGIRITPFDGRHKEAICDMSKDLYDQVYQQMVGSKPKELDTLVEEMSNKLVDKLGVEALELKSTINNIFNVKDTLMKQVENILISDILLSVEQGAGLEGIEGVVTYLKFNDGKKISARLKGKECREPIFDSESYMALRSAIENARQTSRLGVVWLQQFDRLRVCYDATDAECVNIHFYKNLKKEEFEYGLQMFQRYETPRTTERSEVLELENRAQ